MRWRQWMPSSSFWHILCDDKIKGVVFGGSRKALRWGLQLVKHYSIPRTHWVLGLNYIQNWVGTGLCKRERHQTPLSLSHFPLACCTDLLRTTRLRTKSSIRPHSAEFQDRNTGFDPTVCCIRRSIDAPDSVFILLHLIYFSLFQFSQFLLIDSSVFI